MPTKLIEVALPLDAINKEAAREKSIRHGHPSTLHLWWARRPLAACRAVLFAQLVDDPSAHPGLFPTPTDQERERRRLFEIIERLVKWDSANDESVLAEARTEIHRYLNKPLPPILDPFCGGGAIPLEAQRLGLEARASDLNPVAVLITKAIVEMPAPFADRPPVRNDANASELISGRDWKGFMGLAEDVKWYGEWIRAEAERRIGHLYPAALLPDGRLAPAIAWIWARTVTCPNPACRSTMPLVRSFALGHKKGKEAWVNPVPEPSDRRVRFEIGLGRQAGPRPGTVGRSGATCLVCNSPVQLAYIREQAQAGRMSAQLIAVAAEGDRRRVYLPPDAKHESAAMVGRPVDVPDTELPKQALGFRVQGYGMTHHADLFTNRQLTLLCTLSDLVAEGHAKVLSDSGGDRAYADAVATYLAFVVDKQADLSNSLCGWDATVECPHHLFSRQAIPMVWDFAESNPFSSSSGSWEILLRGVTKALLSPGFDFARLKAGSAHQEDALRVAIRDGVISTDPPYYDNIGYADLSDFFYVWLRRSLQHIFPDMFATLLTPKTAELVADPFRFDGGKAAAEDHFEAGFRAVFANAATQHTSEYPMTIFYAFKQSESDVDSSDSVSVASTGWEKMLEGLIGAGLAVTGTWPVRTEASNRMRNRDSNALASSIVLVCRRRSDSAGVTDRRGFIQSLKGTLAHALHDLQSGGIAPVDLAQAAIGPGMAVFSAYAKVVEPDGTSMRVRTALALINQVLDEVSAEQEGEFDEDTRWAIAWYAEQGMDEGTYGRADDLSRAKNVSVDGLVRAGLVKSGGGKVRLLGREELNSSWDPATDSRLTVWEVTQHLIRRLLNDGEASAAELLSKVGGLGDAARDLSYRLFQIAEAKRWAKDAGPYNALAASWLEISRMAAAEPAGQGLLPGLSADGTQ